MTGIIFTIIICSIISFIAAYILSSYIEDSNLDRRTRFLIIWMILLSVIAVNFIIAFCQLSNVRTDLEYPSSKYELKYKITTIDNKSDTTYFFKLKH